MRRMVLALLLSSYLPSADASMVIDGTRIIFPGDKKEIAVRATNMGETPSLTQVWVDDGRVQNQPEKDAAPFIVLPPIVRIEPGKGQSWALAPTGNGLRVSNASARYITIDSITLNGQKHAVGMVAPFSSLEIAPKGVALRTLPAKFSFTTINDYGAVVNHNYPQ